MEVDQAPVGSRYSFSQAVLALSDLEFTDESIHSKISEHTELTASGDTAQELLMDGGQSMIVLAQRGFFWVQPDFDTETDHRDTENTYETTTFDEHVSQYEDYHEDSTTEVSDIKGNSKEENNATRKETQPPTSSTPAQGQTTCRTTVTTSPATTRSHKTIVPRARLASPPPTLFLMHI